ncbi:MAG: hypothetical protein AVDCRST_MAG19-2504, partial [uncultured Thermomicrobiales bacterium]
PPCSAPSVWFSSRSHALCRTRGRSMVTRRLPAEPP